MGRPPDNRTWMPQSKLRALARQGKSYQEIALANEIETGWRPSRATISKKLAELGEPPRYGTRKNLKPWKIKQEHQGHRYRLWLDAEDKRRKGEQLSAADHRALDLMHSVLYGRGVELVIGYCEHHGWYLADREETDVDIIRVSHGNSANNSKSGGNPDKNLCSVLA